MDSRMATVGEEVTKARESGTKADIIIAQAKERIGRSLLYRIREAIELVDDNESKLSVVSEIAKSLQQNVSEYLSD